MSAFTATTQFQDIQKTASALVERCRKTAQHNMQTEDAFRDASSGVIPFCADEANDRLRRSAESLITRQVIDALHVHVGATSWPSNYQPMNRPLHPELRSVISKTWELDLEDAVEELEAELGEGLGVKAALEKAAWEIGQEVSKAKMKPGCGIDFKLDKNHLDSFLEALLFISIYHGLPLDWEQLYELTRSGGYSFGPLAKLASREKVGLHHGLVLTNFKEAIQLHLPRDWVPAIQWLLADHANDRLREILAEAA